MTPTLVCVAWVGISSIGGRHVFVWNAMSLKSVRLARDQSSTDPEAWREAIWPCDSLRIGINGRRQTVGQALCVLRNRTCCLGRHMAGGRRSFESHTFHVRSLSPTHPLLFLAAWQLMLRSKYSARVVPGHAGHAGQAPTHVAANSLGRRGIGITKGQWGLNEKKTSGTH